MAFIEARLLDKVSYGFQIGPQFLTNIKTLVNGNEKRSRKWDGFKWRGTAPYKMIKPEHYQLLLGAHLACGGCADSFRFKNWMDWKVVDQLLGVAPAGSTPIQLTRTYELFGGVTFTRTIRKPVSGTVTVYENGVAKSGTTATSTGLFTPTDAWTPAAVITADFEFDIPMRFASDWMPFTEEEWQARSGDIELIEVFNE